MSDEQNEDQGTAEDPIKNLKAEVSRKLENQSKQMSELMQTNLRLSAQLNQMAQNAAPPPRQAVIEEEDEIDAFDAKSIKKAISRAVNTQVDHRANEFVQDQRRQGALQELGADYPELSDGNSALSRLAVQEFENLHPGMRATAEGYKLAVREAAAKLGLMTNSKRNNRNSDDSTNDDFTGLPGGGSSSGGSRRSEQKPKDSELHPDTLTSAELLGLDITDKKLVERLKKRSQRKNWSKYGG